MCRWGLFDDRRRIGDSAHNDRPAVARLAKRGLDFLTAVGKLFDRRGNDFATLRTNGFVKKSERSTTDRTENLMTSLRSDISSKLGCASRKQWRLTDTCGRISRVNKTLGRIFANTRLDRTAVRAGSQDALAFPTGLFVERSAFGRIGRSHALAFVNMAAGGFVALQDSSGTHRADRTVGEFARGRGRTINLAKAFKHRTFFGLCLASANSVFESLKPAGLVGLHNVLAGLNLALFARSALSDRALGAQILLDGRHFERRLVLLRGLFDCSGGRGCLPVA